VTPFTRPYICSRGLPLHLGQQPEDDRPRCRLLLQVEEQLPECPRLRMTPELADRVGAGEVWEARTWMSSARAAGGRASRRWRREASISSKVTRLTLIRLRDCSFEACRRLGLPLPDAAPLVRPDSRTRS
jgi:hypothetical protein